MKGTLDGRATIFEVAEAAGVSITTVSHVFSGKRRVNAATRERVLDVARRLSYAPNAKAKALATGRTLSLALQVSFTGEALLLNSFFAALLPALSLAAVEHDYSFVYVPPGLEGKGFVAPLVDERRIDGAVLVDPVLGDPFLEAVRASEIPNVTIGGRFQDGSSDNWVDNDHARICAAAAAHLSGRGYARPALLTIDSAVSYVADYAVGFTGSFESTRVAVADAFTPRAAAAAVRDALRGGDPPDAFLCIHDQLALAAEPVIVAEGLEVGRDIGLVCVGDSLFARQARTQLTSIRVFPERFGSAAIAMLDGLIAGANPAAPVLIPSRLVSRASTQRA